MLARLGRTLQDASDSDPELRAALCLAAKHVADKCLVWHADCGQDQGGTQADGMYTCDFPSSKSDDGLSEDLEEPPEPHGILRLLPRSRLLCLLPGLGGSSGKL